MKEINIKVPEKRYAFLMELLSSLGFVKVSSVDEAESREDTVRHIKAGFEEMKRIKSGKEKGTSLKDFLNDV